LAIEILILQKNLNSKDYGMDILPYYIPTSKEDTTLVFESRFESGNLRRAIQMYQFQRIPSFIDE